MYISLDGLSVATRLEPKGDARSHEVISVVFKTPEMHIPLWYWFRSDSVHVSLKAAPAAALPTGAA